MCTKNNLHLCGIVCVNLRPSTTNQSYLILEIRVSPHFRYYNIIHENKNMWLVSIFCAMITKIVHYQNLCSLCYSIWIQFVIFSQSILKLLKEC